MLKDAGKPYSKDAAQAKLMASETATFAAHQAIQVKNEVMKWGTEELNATYSFVTAIQHHFHPIFCSTYSMLFTLLLLGISSSLRAGAWRHGIRHGYACRKALQRCQDYWDLWRSLIAVYVFPICKFKWTLDHQVVTNISLWPPSTLNLIGTSEVQRLVIGSIVVKEYSSWTKYRNGQR